MLYSVLGSACLHMQSGIGNVYSELLGFLISTPFWSLWRSMSRICRLKSSHLRKIVKQMNKRDGEMIWLWVRLYWQLRNLFCQHFTWFWDCQTTRLISACLVWLSSYVLRTGSAYGPSKSGENCHPEWSQRLHYEGKLCNQEQPTWKSGPTSEVSIWWLTFGAPDQHIIKG